MRIENNLYNKNYNYRYTNSNKQQTPSFEGLGIGNIYRAITIKKARSFQEECFIVSDKLGVPFKLLTSAMGTKVKRRRFDFIKQLADNYNAQNFSKAFGKEKEDSSDIMHIIKETTKPESEHFNILYRSNMPFKTLNLIFKKAKTKEALGFIQKMQHNVLDGTDESAHIILKMLESPHKATFIKNPENYSSYLRLNYRKATCVEDLEKLIETGEYSKSKFDKKLRFEKMMKHRKINPVINRFSNFIEANLTEENEKFIRHFCENFLGYKNNLSNEDYIDILKMYKTTSDKNIKTRLRIIEKFKHNPSESKAGKSDIREMRNLFNHIDSNPHKASFIEKALNSNIKIESIENLNKILSVVPPKKAEIFYKNIVRIVKFTSPEERISALETEIENPFFPRRRVSEKIKRDVINNGNLPSENGFKKIARYIENELNIRKYSKITEDMPQDIIPLENEPEIFAIPKNFIDIPQISKSLIIPVTTDKESKINLLRTLKSSPKARRLQVKSDVNEIIKKKLGQKTYESQSRDYDIKATAMRLKMLPEIFESMSAVRKEQRMFSKRPNIENKDALQLYEKITGKNRKLIRYMLKQTDENNIHLFDIKTISEFIDKAELKIAQEKKLNSEYKAADAKAYYEELFQNMVAEHGKLKRSKKTA